MPVNNKVAPKPVAPPKPETPGAAPAAAAGGAATANDTKGWTPNAVLQIGMNPNSVMEDAALTRAHVPHTYVHDSGNPGVFKDDAGRTFDLNQDAGMHDFAKSLGLSPQGTAGVADALAHCDGGARDELAGIAQQWKSGEHGGRVPSRLILSGENADGISGENNGMLTWDALERLSRAMPKAAGQVDHLCLSACNTASPGLVKMFKEKIFPNLQTFWAYRRAAPRAEQGAGQHEVAWWKMTQQDPSQFHRPNLTHVATWKENKAAPQSFALQDGFPTRNVNELRGDVAARQATYDKAFRGEHDPNNPDPTDPHDDAPGTLRSYYNALADLDANPAISDGEHVQVRDKMARTERLMFWSDWCAPRFSQRYAPQINDGFAALNLPPPDFSTMTRKQALDTIAHFEQVLDTRRDHPRAAQALQPLLEGLRTLSPQIVPQS